MIYRIIGKNIRARRVELQMTQQKLAEVSLSFLGHIERGTRKLSVDTLYKIARSLECSADELMGLPVVNDTQKKMARRILNQMMVALEQDI